MNKNKVLLFSWLAVILWMMVIFSLSAQVREQSNELSTGITEIMVEIVERIIPNIDLDIPEFNHIIRKSAHFSTYLILGILVMNALRKSGIKGYRSGIYALGICTLYAISDEVHQLFVPGRGAQVTDVIIDTFGASVGIGLRSLRRRRD